ncbi:MAG: alginate export family protein, partial [Candidatus Omnitrophica bacterium]|nr:alginate export family protein [Candidatus Omnitrophota bacterium]
PTLFRSAWVVRDGFDLGVGASDAKQNDVMSFLRLRVDADLTDNVSVVVRLLNERTWGDVDNGTTTDNTDINVDLAYVEMREMLYSPLTVTIGRQVLSYGNGLILGDGPNNETTGPLSTVSPDLSKVSGIDAIKAVLDYDPLTVDIFAAVIDDGNAGMRTQDKTDDTNLYGINVNYAFNDEKGTVAEAYFFSKVIGLSAGESDYDTVQTPGFRVSSNVLDGLMLSGELAWQFGRNTVLAGTDSIERNAMAAQLIANYMIPFEKTKKYNPMVTTAYTYLSGDSNPSDSAAGEDSIKYSAWDPMYESQGCGKIYNALFDLTNAHIYSVALSAEVMQDVMAKLSWTGLWLDKKLPLATWQPLNMYIDGVRTTTYAVNTDKKALGNEFDLDLTYDYTEDVVLSLSTGIYLPGSVFADANEDAATQAILSVLVNF